MPSMNFSLSPWTIEKWFGRLGNNIQQICLGILHAERFGYRFFSPAHELIRPVGYHCPALFRYLPKRRNRFFFFANPTPGAVVDTEGIDYDYVCGNIHRVAQAYLGPALLVPRPPPFDDDVLVIHLRGGDIFAKDYVAHRGYVQNPVDFYRQLISSFRKTIVVAEPGHANPMLSALMAEFRVEVRSNSVAEDFSTLLRARNLATSGVGTFAVAAALCSSHLRNFYCSDRFLREHLNPDMLDRAKVGVFCTPLPGYIEIGDWDAGAETLSRLMEYRLPFA